MRRRIVVVSLIAVGAAGLGWYLLPKRRPVTVPAQAKAGDLSLESSRCRLGDKEYAADQGVLVVPENRTESSARLIALPVLRIRSRAAQPAEPIFWLSGGPGTSNLDFRPSQRLLENHDFVLVGYRGVDGSVRLDSPDIARARRGARGDLTGAASNAAFRAAVGRFADDARRRGTDLRGYTLPEVIADVEAARRALRYPRIHLLSASYGTRLAQIYAFQHPEAIGRSAMISVNPPGHFAWDARMTDRQLGELSRLYARDPPPGKPAADLREAMRRVLIRLPARYWGLRFDANKLRAITFVLLFQRRTMALVADAYLAADRGDFSGLMLMQVSYDLIFPRMGAWGDFVCKGYNADFDPARDYGRDFAVGDTVLGSPITLLVFAGGGGLPVPLVPAELRASHDTNVETLLLGGDLDFSTPADFARDELLPHLRRGRQIVLSTMGHFNDVWSLEYHATQNALVTFYDTGVADASGFTPLPMDFRVSWGFPLIAKLVAGGIPLLAIGAACLLRWLWRRRKSARRSVA